MNTTFHLYRPGLSTETHAVDLPAQPGLDALKAVIEPLLDGAVIEHVLVLFEDRRADMFVDETGAMKGLPRNEGATAIYRASWMKRRPSTYPETLPAIYGPAVVFTRQVWF